MVAYRIEYLELLNRAIINTRSIDSTTVPPIFTYAKYLEYMTLILLDD